LDTPGLLSLALPVFNGAQYLALTLDNLRAQRFANWELLVCDNASTDETAAIVARYAKTDPRIRYVRHDHNLGLAPNHNYGFHNTTGEFFAWVHADNAYHPDYFGACVEYLTHDPTVSCVHSKTISIDDAGVHQKTWDEGLRGDSADVATRYYDLTKYDHMCFAMLGVSRRSMLRQTKLHAPFDGADQLTIVELALRGRVVQLDRPLFFHREHSGRVNRQAPSVRARYVIIDPAWRGRVPFPAINLGYQYVTAVWRAPLSRIDKVRCWAQLTGWLRVNWVRMLRALARGCIEYLRLGLSRIRNLLQRRPGRHLGSDRTI
jgi:glycosyltransferase involved in cell wall biosynthesis